MRKLICLYFLLGILSCGAQDIIKDINTALITGNNAADYSAQLGNTVIFSINDNIHGQELWKSDGTAGGTVMIKDIYPGITGSVPALLVNFNNQVFFLANDGPHGNELWKTDGTEAGTQMVKDTEAGMGGLPLYLKTGSNLIYFLTGSQASGYHLWTSDGTDAGTQSIPVPLTDVGQGAVFSNKLFFTARSANEGSELWVSDGTAAGTHLFLDINAGNPDATPDSYNSTGNYFYFGATTTIGKGLWASDGTVAGTKLIFQPTFFNVAAGTNELYFVTLTAGANQLWHSDGTPSGTNAITNTGAGQPNNIQALFVDGPTLYFSATNGSTGNELWTTTSTPGTAQLLKEIQSGSGSSFPQNLTKVNGTIYFLASTTANGNELWKSDGTGGGTVMVKDLVPGVAEPSSVISFKGGTPNPMFFFSDITNGKQPWTSDGTSGGTSMILKIIAGNAASSPASLTVFNNKVIFRANDNDHAFELWTTDGTLQNTKMIVDLNPGAVSGAPSSLFSNSSAICFVGLDASGFNLFKTDGTAAGTLKLSSIGIGNYTGSLGENLYMVALNSTGWQLWKTDGTTIGTVLVKQMSGPFNGSGQVSGATVVNATLYYIGNDGTNGGELWKSDGTTGGTAMVKNISASGSSNPTNLGGINNKLIFSADDGIAGRELWVSDGTSPGTVMLKDINTGPSGSLDQSQTAVTNAVYFKAYDPINGYGLWKTDGTIGGTSIVKPLMVNSSSIFVGFATIVAYQGIVFFAAEDAAHGVELWKTDGTTTSFFADILPGALSSGIEQLRVVNDKLFFTARDASNVTKIWYTDGTAANTHAIDFVNPVGNFVLSEMKFLNGKYILPATGTYGTELYTFNFDPVTGLENVKATRLDFYPNPSSGTFYVNEEIPDHSRVCIFDQLGRMVSETTIVNGSFQISSLPSGLYVVRVQNGDRVITQKLVKQ